MTEIKFNVLIAEDEENIGNFISTILKTNGYKPIIATTGNQAIQCAESYCPDVILLDLGLPDMDGIDVISEIRKWAVTPIIVISARNRESEKVKALDAGADDYITKPFGNQELLARIRTALRHRRQPMGAETKTPMYHAGPQISLMIDSYVITFPAFSARRDTSLYSICVRRISSSPRKTLRLSKSIFN